MNPNTPSPSRETFQVSEKEKTKEPTGELVTKEQVSAPEVEAKTSEEPATPEMVIEEIQEPVKPILKEEKILPTEIDEDEVTDSDIKGMGEAFNLQEKVG